MYLISFYVPESHLEQVKQALFAKGAGNIGNYDSCAWSVKGTGQFRPCKGSSPYSGVMGTISFETEYKVEMVCHDHLIQEALKELLRAHPYEEPAYHAIKLLTLDDFEDNR